MYKSIFFLLLIFTCATLCLLFLTTYSPDIKYEGNKNIKFPNNIEELKSLAFLLKQYYKEYWSFVLILFSFAYLYKQAFMIPGSALLNILAGAIFGVYIALPLCCILTSLGATCSFFLSKTFGRQLIERLFSQKLRVLNDKVDKNKNNLFYYLLFLRLFPMSPNWLINLLCPLIGVPLKIFIASIFIGLLPYNFICVQAGEILSTIQSLDEIFTLKMFSQLAAIAVAALGPSFLFKKVKTDF